MKMILNRSKKAIKPFSRANATGFTEKAIKELTEAGATNEILEMLVAKIAEFPPKYKIDTFDGINCLGVNLSFIRNNPNNSCLILTTKEAQELD